MKNEFNKKANDGARTKHSNFFPAPHIPFDDEKLRRTLTHAERDFLITLCHLTNRYADSDGWFWHTDESFITRDDKERGFLHLVLAGPLVGESERN